MIPKVTILAETDCQVLCWQKSTLQYFLGKESFLAQIFAIVLANDVSNKLYKMNEKVQLDQGFYLDVRCTLFLPSTTEKLALPADRPDDASSTQSLQPRPIRLTA